MMNNFVAECNYENETNTFILNNKTKDNLIKNIEQLSKENMKNIEYIIYECNIEDHGKNNVNLDDIKLVDNVYNFNSDIFDNSQNNCKHTPFKMVYFENEKQIELFERENCEGDNNTWGSWVSEKDKFKFPCWIAVSYQKYEYDNSYIARYLTKEEFTNELKDIINQVENLNNKGYKLL